MNTPINRGVSKGPRTTLLARFSGLPQVKGYFLFFSKNLALTPAYLVISDSCLKLYAFLSRAWIRTKIDHIVLKFCLLPTQKNTIMDLQLNQYKYLVTGASAGLGRAVAETLLKNGAGVWAVARRKDLLKELSDQWTGRVTTIPGDITDPAFLRDLKQKIPEDLYGAFLNSGGPPAATISETSIDEWDQAYNSVLRWKVDLSKFLMEKFLIRHKGRLLFSESASVNSPIPNLVLSNSFRMAVVGYMKTMVKEIHHEDITVNVIAPGYHETGALNRLIKKMADQKNLTEEEAQKDLKSRVPVGRLGKPEEFASLAAWLLSPMAGFASGQIFTLDGGEGR